MDYPTNWMDILYTKEEQEHSILLKLLRTDPIWVVLGVAWAEALIIVLVAFNKL